MERATVQDRSATDTALACYAACESRTHGRRHEESAPRYRSEYQRDRDRIVHSAAFRRLEYKTQVFVNHEGDMFRTRLTHSIEVAQIARTIARVLRLNEALTEAIALAHDLGHTPFGHAGQDALNNCMRDYGGFEHNLQSLRVVDELEEKYADFTGLNLMFETREGILKHCSLRNARELGDVGLRFLNNQQPSLEAQVANLADEIAYNNHDIDDGLRARLITIEGLRGVQLFQEQYRTVADKYPRLAARRAIHEIVRRMINRQVTDLIEASSARLTEHAPDDIDDVRTLAKPLIDFSHEMRSQVTELKQYLHGQLYCHYRVQRMSAKAARIVRALFDAFMEDPQLLPPEHAQNVRRLEQDRGTAGRARGIADYIAGMTDRFAIAEYRKMFDAGSLT